MSGGISAIKGFDYQATVILDRLFNHFEHHGLSAKARPEGMDDLDLSWTEEGIEYREYIQIKKPTENKSGELNPTPWKLAEVVRDLLPKAITQLLGNKHRQLWIVGDKFDDSVSSLINAHSNAPIEASQPYWETVHILAKKEAIGAVETNKCIKNKISHWKIPSNISSNPDQAKKLLKTELKSFIGNLFESEEQCNSCKTIHAAEYKKHATTYIEKYLNRLTELHGYLPNILARVEIIGTYGSEQEVTQRVYDKLTQCYSLQRTVIENTVFRNLRGFINDISKQPGRFFNHEELEMELRCVWPQMIPIKDLPRLESDYIYRGDLTEQFTTKWTGKAIELIGISGAGKTKLAAEIAESSRKANSERLVYYAEVRSSTSLRDVLVGIAFHLRRQGINEPFSIGITYNINEEYILELLAGSYSIIPSEILLLIDFVDGTCATAFARDLATFIRHLSSSSCRIAVFAQESILRELTPLERDKHSISRLDIRGFSFEEFAKLVTHHHSNPDCELLQNIYQRVTAGRASGLFAKLAHLLASAVSIQNMLDIAAQPAENILAYAEQMRFAQISEGARGAAEKLVCFSLPFRRQEAEEVFPNENIGQGIRELLTQGLLSYHDKDSFEMHETVRAGLEGLLAVNVRHFAHQELAAWYSSQQLITAEIFHLEKAGKLPEAKMRARELFLSGEQWPAILAYVIQHKLISSKDVIEVISGSKTLKHCYLLTNILKDLGESVLIVDQLFEIIRKQTQRYYTDYQWGPAITEAILEFESEQLYNLITFSVNNTTNQKDMESALRWLKIAMYRKDIGVTLKTIDFFRSQPDHIKRILAEILLCDRRREILQVALEFILSSQEQHNEQSRHNFSLHIDTLSDTIEFLAAIPQVSPSSMLISKSVLPGPLTSLVWSARTKLHKYCIEAIKNNSNEVAVIENAIRILIFFGEPSLFNLCEPFLNRKDSVKNFAIFLPAFQPAFFDYSRYETKLFDRNATLEDRVTALYIIALASTVNLGYIYNRLTAALDSKERPAWDFIFLILSIQKPFYEAITLLEAHMSSLTAKGNISLIHSLLMKLGELPVPDATTMLTSALTHSSSDIRHIASLRLSRRRSRIALPKLIEQYSKENNEELAVGLAVAIVASGSKSALDLQGQKNSPVIQLWQCILTMRSRDVSMADKMVSIAIDPLQNWKLRRTAIFAAGRLPYTVALEKIVPVIMAESSPLTIDHSRNLGCHSVISSFLMNFSNKELASIFIRGKAGFIDFFATLFEKIWSDWFWKQGLPSGEQAAGWFYDRLEFYEYPKKKEALDYILNELSIPLLQSAALRSLRLCERADLIEQYLASAKHVWIAMKCLSERKRAGNLDSGLVVRLRALVEASPYKDDAILYRIINEFDNNRATIQEKKSIEVTSNKELVPVTYITYEDAANALSGKLFNFKPTLPLVLTNITAEQCEQLIRLANPVNDTYQWCETYIPMIKFIPNGHLVGQSQRTSRNAGESTNALIRAAIIAANSFGLLIPWQDEIMRGYCSSSFIQNYLDCLGVLNDSSQFYDALSKYEEILFAYLCNPNQYESVQKYIDARIIPMLQRYIASGTDKLFEGLCILTLQVNVPEIDIILSGLLYRWSQRFDKMSFVTQHDNNPALWRGFKRLTEHPRFTNINEWMNMLEQVLQTPIKWFHAETIVRVLERDPRSYILIESRLFKTENWEHFHIEEIDLLDVAADHLYRQLLEE